MNNLPNQYNSRNVPAGAMDVWNANPGAGALAVPNPQQAAPAAASPVAVVQRLLRGRVALAVVLAGMGAIIGGTAGYMSQAPQYKALGEVSITPIIPMVEGDKTMPYYQQFMFSEAKSKFNSQAVMDAVPLTEPWKSKVGKNNDALADLANNLTATYTRNTYLIDLVYTNPNQDVAAAGVQTVLKVYADQFKKNSNNQIAGKIEELKKRMADVEAKNDAAQAAIIDVTRAYGTTDLEPLRSSAQQTVEAVQKDLRGNENNLKLATDAIGARKDGNGKLSTAELAAVSPILAKLINELRDMQADLQFQQSQMGSNNPRVRTLKQAIEFKQAAIDGLADSLRTEVLAIIPDMVKGGNDKQLLTAGDLKLLENRVSTLRDELKDATEKRDAIAAAAAKVATQQVSMKKYALDLQAMTDRMTAMNYQAASTGTLDIVADGRFAAKDKDKKVLFGLAGALGGAMVPVGLLMLMGLLDTRFRYSDDAAGQSMAGIPLLGILPNLPDRLSDPAQASIAAHCVHQIRTMLQLNAMREHSTAFAITSASSGDGKTSLSLALGLSFAASGSRTLLIDADLIGGGLSSRLGNDTNVGIVDALAGVGLEECVQPTDVADLSLLPIGGAQAHHAGSFSPPAVRKLLNEIRKHYEVIIIDTGPVMGSIEATPVCASCDGVVLTVARGQSRPLVERAIAHLNSIGARVAGVVFNRAQHKDFEQSIGAISVRSAARSTSTMNGTGHNGRKNGDMGAVASAVAGSVTRDN